MKQLKSFDQYGRTLSDPRPSDQLMASISVDCLIFGFDEGKLEILLIKHDGGPKHGYWALPGDYIDFKVSLEDMARSILFRLTGLNNIFIKQMGAFGEVDRVDTKRVVTVVYYALVNSRNYTLKVGPGASEAKWFPIEKVPELIFDHNHILNTGVHQLRGLIKREPVGFELLPNRFTLTQLQSLYETILNKSLDTRNFRRKLKSLGIVDKTNEKAQNVPYRAPFLYEFNKHQYEILRKEGFHFELK